MTSSSPMAGVTGGQHQRRGDSGGATAATTAATSGRWKRQRKWKQQEKEQKINHQFLIMKAIKSDRINSDNNDLHMGHLHIVEDAWDRW